MTKRSYSFHVNGRDATVEARPETPLIYVLRNQLGLKGTRFGCGSGDCGSCMVLIDGVAEKACQVTADSNDGRSVETVEGLAEEHELSALQQALLDQQAGQCGYCLSGIVMTATALLRRNPNPSESEVREALDDNLCRCGSHARILAAVMGAGIKESGA